ncbi:class GN sortase [Shewanella pneumatophori]
MTNFSGFFYQRFTDNCKPKGSGLAKVSNRTRHFHRFSCWSLLLVGALLMAQGGYMQAKAYFAQFLIQQAWQKTLQDRRPHKPWSWADTHPVAKMDFLPANIRDYDSEHARLNGDSLYVLAGASGRNLAFGPAQMLSSANINSRGNTVIAGHRDTHFARLNGIKLGQLIRLQSATGKSLVYKVIMAEVVHESDMTVTEDSGESLLTLVTCYPFGAEFAGGEQRFVVQAVPIN